MKNVSLCRLLGFFLVMTVSPFCSRSQTSSLAAIGSGGKLEYTLYANTGQTNSVNRVPDFSFAGYRGGGVSLPSVPTVEIVQPVSGDAKAVVQAAIDRVSALPVNANGFRGAVLLKSGRYEVSGPLYIKASGVVLRGEGQNTSDKNGTELVATAKTQHDLIQLEGSEITSESSSETLLDKVQFPPARTWSSFSVLKGVAEELEGNKILSIHLTADVGQYVNYSSKEDSLPYRPVLEIVSASSSVPIRLQPIADTYVQGGTSAKVNYGGEISVAIKNSGVNANVTREGYLKFDLSGISDSVQKATLNLFAKKDLAADTAAIKVVFISAYKIDNDAWDEMTLTYETRPLPAGSTGSKRIASDVVPCGALSFDVDDASGLAVGDTIKITRTPNDAWINALDMAQYGWVSSEYWISYERIITALQGNRITVNIPLVQMIEKLYGGGEVSKISVRGRISRCGVENMLISSYYASDDDESHGWSAITLSHTTDSWVRKVTARYFGYSCVGLYWAYNTTVEECAMLDPKSITTGSRKYSFYIDKGSFNLFQRCYTRGGRHDYVTGSRVAGPNAFVDCYSTQTYADIGPHHRYATGILFDNIQGGETRVQNRKDMGSGHGWAGAQTMFWNCISNTSEFKVESPIGAMNWGIGCSGLVKSGAGFWESWGTKVAPRSLYFQQLKDRLGSSAVETVTLPLQRSGNIWTQLSTWSGIGDFSAQTRVSSEGNTIPYRFSLSQNFPNPFNPVTTIRFTVPANGRAILKIYSTIGQEIATIYDNETIAGKENLVQFDASNLASGQYFSRLEFEGKELVKKLLLIK
ncbi:MAG: DNRLRE domain-containing protein [Ignavibacteriales bacterium]|nr:DNRLRE domain-containing protein [Ignavibacteriales bacterium]